MNKFLLRLFNEGLPVFIAMDGDAGDGAGGGAGDSDGDASSGGAEMVSFKDPISGNEVQVPKNIEVLLGHVVSSTRKSIESKYKPLIEKLEGDTSELAEVRLELEKMKEANMSAEEKAQANAKRLIAEADARTTDALEKAETWEGEFIRLKKRVDIMNSFGNIVLCNPEQTAMVFEREGDAQVVPVLDSEGKAVPGQFQTRLSLNLTDEKSGELRRVEGTPKELFKKWINEDNNLHHQLNDLSPGGNSNGGGHKGKRAKDYLKMSATERLRAAREE